MTNFTARQVLSEYKAIGDQLKLAREERGFELLSVARHLKTKVEYLKALEDENYKEIPGGIYGKILFKRYCQFLKLDHKNFLKTFSKDRKLQPSSEADVFSKKVVNKSDFLVFPKIIRNAIIITIILICFLYLSFYLKKITAPPFLEISSPIQNQTQSELTALIKGSTEPESEVAINGQPVLTDKAGKFEQSINLKPGVNIIIVKSKKKHSRDRIVTRQILVE